MYKEITLKEGDKLRILPETKFFYFGCCTCNMVHRITVEHTKKGISLGFFEHKPKLNTQNQKLTYNQGNIIPDQVLDKLNPTNKNKGENK